MQLTRPPLFILRDPELFPLMISTFKSDLRSGRVDTTLVAQVQHLRGVSSHPERVVALENDGWKPLLAWDLQVDVKLFSSPQRSSRRSGCAPAIHLLAVACCSCCPSRTSGTARTRAGTSPRPLEEKTNWYDLGADSNRKQRMKKGGSSSMMIIRLQETIRSGGFDEICRSAIHQTRRIFSGKEKGRTGGGGKRGGPFSRRHSSAREFQSARSA